MYSNIYNLNASIVITTKNRKIELSRAVESCLKLKGNPEILVFDDGSEDGTYEYIKNKYPSVNIHREESSIGLIDARTKAASMVQGDIIFSIDDDACFTDANTVLDILAFFNHQNVAVVSIPYVDVYKSNVIKQKAIGTSDKIYICAYYRGTAHALRKDVFEQMGGYRKDLFRGGEETDYAIRLFKNNYWIRIGRSKPIFHYESPNRDKHTITFYHAQNNLLLAWIYSPFIIVIPYILYINIRLVIYGLTNKCLQSIMSGIISFYRLIGRRAHKRSPLALSKFISYKILIRKSYRKIKDLSIKD